MADEEKKAERAEKVEEAEKKVEAVEKKAEAEVEKVEKELFDAGKKAAGKSGAFLKEFKAFALKGNMVDLAVGVIIGGAFNSIVSSLVDDVVMPTLSVFMGKVDFNNMFFALDGNKYATLKAATDVTSVIAYGTFLSNLINFVIMALVVFIVIKQLNKFHKTEAPAAPTEKVCPYCKSKIDINATRCPHCTSELQ